MTIDPNERVIKAIGFREFFNTHDIKLTLELATFIPEQDYWVRKQSLLDEGFLNDDGTLKDGVSTAGLTALDEDTEFFSIGNIETALEKFENKWIPIPYLKTNDAGGCMFSPANWARVFLKPLTENKGKLKEYDVILSFDTQLGKYPGDLESPRLSDYSNDNNYQLCGNEDLILNYCDANLDCGWVDEYIASIFHGGKTRIPTQFPSLKYIGHYIYFIKYLATIPNKFPEVELYTDKTAGIDVDLVLDIGNANTCGILFENPKDANFDFTAVKKLKIQDLTNLEKDYSDPFSMQLVFSKCNFGEIGYNSSKFQWPSVLRIGEEAGYLINDALIDVNSGVESASYHSSPKRYLWDEEKYGLQWEFARTKGQRNTTPVYLKGISEQFQSDGKFTLDVNFGSTSQFSRKSLMTFVFLEILAQALGQINAHDFRFQHGHLNHPRRLRRLLITCPTAMIQREQVALRQCAEEAIAVLNRYKNNTYEIAVDLSQLVKEVEVIPSVKDLTKDLADLSSRQDWIYDEATCCQLVFLYGEISKRYLNESDVFFHLHGKKRADLDGYDKNAITIGSIDIGGGTTDLMICAYQYNYSPDMTELTPKPLYWESFNLAGDDFLQQIIQQIILEGRATSPDDTGCVGVIENHGRAVGALHILDKLNSFFGSNSNNISYANRIMRKNFNVQVLIPIAKRYLEHARNNHPDEVVGFDRLFPELKPNVELLHFFNLHFGFPFENIQWKLSTRRVNTILEATFEPLIKQLSTLAFAYGCDYVLLAGKPTSLERIEELCLKFFPVRPDRVITLNKYRVGRWYPFADDGGYFKDPKTIVSVGALIAFMGGRNNQLSGFKINQEFLKTKIVSTAEYFGIYHSSTRNIESLFLTPEENRSELVVNSLPAMFGFKQLNADKYPGRPAYVLDFNTKKISDQIKRKDPALDANGIADQMLLYKNQLRNRMPFHVKISREYRDNKEKLSVDAITDRERNDVSTALVGLKVQTLQQDTGYWLDTGAFQLRVRD
jgi:hypothetical protein